MVNELLDNGHDMDEITNRVLSLFKYIQALNKLKHKTVKNTNEYRFCKYISELPEDPINVKLFYQDRLEDDIEDVDKDYNGNILLSVHKQEYSSCPVPPESIKEWLKFGWEDYRKSIELYDEFAVENYNALTGEYEEVILRFEDDEIRGRDFSYWKQERDKWVKKQEKIQSCNDLFYTLYGEYFALKRDSETHELIVANGMFCDANDNEICHPLLTHRVVLDFNAELNTVYIRDTDASPGLYTDILKDEQGINLQEISTLVEKLIECDYHPLDRNETPGFLKILIRQLSSKGLYSNDGIPEDWEQHYKFLLYNDPCFIIRKKLDGTVKAIEKITESIEAGKEIPKAIIDLVKGGKIDIPVDDHEYTIEEQLAMVGGESVDVLLSKPANREQLEIANRIEQYNAVLVQGPPGTGKTHTIANLLGHFIAQGKSVLVTSHTTKALTVLKDKIEGDLKKLCVSLLDESNEDMKKSVEEITDFMSRNSSVTIKREMDDLNDERKGIIQKLAEIRKKIYLNIHKECENIIYNGEGITPSQAARFVAENQGKLDYIPGYVQPNAPLPLSFDELVDLYHTNEIISEDDAIELSYDLPPLCEFIKENEFDELCQKISAIERKNSDINSSGVIKVKYVQGEKLLVFEVLGHVISIPLPAKKVVEDLNEYCVNHKNIEEWQRAVVIDGKAGGGFRERWVLLIDQIEQLVNLSATLASKGLGVDITFAEGIFISDLLEPLRKVKEMYEENGRLPWLFSMRFGEYYKALNLVRIAGKTPNSASDCELAIMRIEQQVVREKCSRYWRELLVSHGMPEFEDFGAEPERIAEKYIPSILYYLDWHNKEYKHFVALLDAVGFPENEICDISGIDSDAEVLEKRLIGISKVIPVCCDACMDYIQLTECNSKLEQLSDIATSGNRINSVILQELNCGISERNTIKYGVALKQLGNVYEKYGAQYRRNEYLKRLTPYAPDWAEAINQHHGIHGAANVPSNIEDAWKYCQLSMIIENITKIPLEELQKESRRLSQAYRDITARYAEKCGWYHLLLRTEKDLTLRQALQGWMAVVKKIGKGTGKRAPEYKAEARKLMEQCQNAVPAWIMPIDKALDSLNPDKNSFDIVIVDEASQSDISSLAVLYMGKKQIIVGDDKQVSPMAVGLNVDNITNLRKMYLSDDIPNNIIYDPTTSIYDIAMTTYTPLMLREHFRCVPDIIGYSNWLSYDGKIKPLRAANDSNILPAVVNYRVDGGERSGKQKINEPEAKAIVALIRSCIEQPEYRGKTIGVISLLGADQAKLIESLIHADDNISPSEIENRCILCGDSSNFQGDERDIIFLSMVDCPENPSETLRNLGYGSNDAYRKRYNVATSRARDQLWVVNSIDLGTNLKAGDIRRGLLEYALNPHSRDIMEKEVQEKAESPFEVAVAMALKDRGFNVVQQWEVGAYRIDMVINPTTNQIAIECDGERWHSSEVQIRNDMERQTILERIGWNFIRIRGSEYYSQPEKTIERVVAELEKLNVKSVPYTVEERKDNSELLNRVKNRAEIILNPSEPVGHNPKDIGGNHKPIENINDIPSEKINTGSEDLPPKNDIKTANTGEQMTLFNFDYPSSLLEIKKMLNQRGYEVVEPVKPKDNELWVISLRSEESDIKKLIGNNFSIKYDRGRIQSGNKSFHIVRSVTDGKGQRKNKI